MPYMIGFPLQFHGARKNRLLQAIFTSTIYALTQVHSQYFFDLRYLKQKMLKIYLFFPKLTQKWKLTPPPPPGRLGQVN
jgi:hypothetical protein